jgi:hypothetical protein
VTTIVLSSTVTVRAQMRVQSENVDLEHWHRLGCLAWVHADQHGHARMATGQAGRELCLSVNQVTDAIAVARRRGWLDPASTARCLVLPGCASNPCEESHR